jgi:hypothetical protein
MIGIIGYIQRQVCVELRVARAQAETFARLQFSLDGGSCPSHLNVNTCHANPPITHLLAYAKVRRNP